jgi:hypothetical protein
MGGLYTDDDDANFTAGEHHLRILYLRVVLDATSTGQAKRSSLKLGDVSTEGRSDSTFTVSRVQVCIKGATEGIAKVRDGDAGYARYGLMIKDVQ